MKITTLIGEKVTLKQEYIRRVFDSYYTGELKGYIIGIGGVQTGYHDDDEQDEHTFWIVELDKWLYMKSCKCSVKALLLLSCDFDIDNYNEEC